MTSLLILVAAFLASCALVESIRRYALRRGIIDTPNHRSSHKVATPRGGGVAIVVVALLAIIICTIRHQIPVALGVALAGGGTLVAAIGWRDDRGHVGVRLRLATQFVAAAAAVALLHGMGPLHLEQGSIDLGPFGALVATIGIVWMTNLYNFMDGIDGIAAGEAVSVAAVGAALLSRTGQSGYASLLLIVGAAALGFLIFNWHPARIFMGDAGAGFLGFFFATLALASHNDGGPSIIIWTVLLGVFVVDATVTLIRRAYRGERVTEAHRSHAYQRLTDVGWSHAKVSAAVIIANVAVGLACFAALGTGRELVYLLLTLTLLVAIQLTVSRKSLVSAPRDSTRAAIRREGSIHP